MQRSEIDWQLWFAYMEGVSCETEGWMCIEVEVPEEELRLMRAATVLVSKWRGLRPREFMELAVWEKLEELEWRVGYDIALSRTGPQPCFICGELTERIDICFEAPFCGSGTCEWAIDEDLRMSSERIRYDDQAA